MVIECPQCHSRYESTEAGNQKFIHCQCGVSIQIPDLPKIAKSWSCPNCAGDVKPTQTIEGLDVAETSNFPAILFSVLLDLNPSSLRIYL